MDGTMHCQLLQFDPAPLGAYCIIHLACVIKEVLQSYVYLEEDYSDNKQCCKTC